MNSILDKLNLGMKSSTPEQSVEKNLKIISVHSRKGGVGKTTIAIALAKKLKYSVENPDVLFIDLDIFGSSIAHALSNRYWFNDMAICRNRDRILNLLTMFEESIGMSDGGGNLASMKFAEDKINVISSDDLETNQDGSASIYRDSSILFDMFVGKQFIGFVWRIIDNFVARAKARRVYVILDNSPGYVGYVNELHEKMLDIGPDIGKFLFVMSMNEQDIQECILALDSIKKNYERRVDAMNWINEGFPDNSLSIVDNTDSFIVRVLAEDRIHNSVLHGVQHYKSLMNNTEKLDYATPLSYTGFIINMVMPELKEKRHDYVFSRSTSKSRYLRAYYGMDTTSANTADVEEILNIDPLNKYMISYSELYRWLFFKEKVKLDHELTIEKKSRTHTYPHDLNLQSLTMLRTYDSKYPEISLIHRIYYYWQQISNLYTTIMRNLETARLTQLSRIIPSKWDYSNLITDFRDFVCQEIGITTLSKITLSPSKITIERLRSPNNVMYGQIKPSVLDIWGDYIEARQPYQPDYLISFKMLIIMLLNSIEMYSPSETQILRYVKNILVKYGDFSTYTSAVFRQGPDLTMDGVVNIRKSHDDKLLWFIHRFTYSCLYAEAYRLIVNTMISSLTENKSGKRGMKASLNSSFGLIRLGDDFFVNGKIKDDEFKKNLNVDDSQSPKRLVLIEDVLEEILHQWNM